LRWFNILGAEVVSGLRHCAIARFQVVVVDAIDRSSLNGYVPSADQLSKNFIMREHKHELFFSCITAAMLLVGFNSIAQATEQDEFDDLACVKYVVIIDKLVQLRDDGFPKSSVYKAANEMNEILFTKAVASVYEFQKEMSRDQIDLYSLGWCEGQGEAITEEETGDGQTSDLVRLNPRHRSHSLIGRAI
jgi:hypothetical protein